MMRGILLLIYYKLDFPFTPITLQMEIWELINIITVPNQSTVYVVTVIAH